jgi:HlyD family secretion protein
MDRILQKKPWWIRRKGWLISGIIFIVILSIMVFSSPEKTYRINREFLTIKTILRDTFIDFTNVTGTIEPGKVVFIDAVESGKVERILVEEGVHVTKGQPLVQLSNNNLLLDISNNEALVARAINDLRTARLQMEMNAMQMQNGIVRLQSELIILERDYLNNQSFFEEKLISEDLFIKSKQAWLSAKRQMELLQKTYTRDSIYRSIQVQTLEESARQMETNQIYIRKRLENLIVKSIVDGELASIELEEGQVISYGTRIGKINITDTYKINAQVDEHYITQIHRGLTGICEFQEKKYPAIITKIYSEVENGQFAVDLNFTDTLDQSFHMGQTCRIKLELGKAQLATLIPKGAFFQSTGGQWIFVLSEDKHSATRRSIHLGRQNPDYYEVLSGLEQGESIIISGYDNFEEAEVLVFK